MTHLLQLDTRMWNALANVVQDACERRRAATRGPASFRRMTARDRAAYERVKQHYAGVKAEAGGGP